MSKKILIVDDALFMRKLLKDLLEAAGYEVVGEAENGREGFEAYLKLKPDLVTMDITMPEVTGLESLQMIIEADPSAQVIMCSAMGQEKMVTEAILRGAKGFLVKPFNRELVLSEVAKVLTEAKMP